MMGNKNRNPIAPVNGGFIYELALRLKLILKLMGDGRVNLFIKAIPLLSVIYWLFPFDIPGPIDDLAVVSLGFYLFIELCPPEVVEEHLKGLRNPNIMSMKTPPSPDSVVDVNFNEVDQSAADQEHPQDGDH
jgi:hypothetical protein